RHAGIRRPSAHLAAESAWAEPLAQLLLVDPDLLRLALRDLRRSLAADVGEPPLEVAHTGFSRVLTDDRAQHLVRERQLRTLEACSRELLREQVTLGDPELLGLRVTRERDRVHAVEQRPWDRVHRVRRAD